MRVTSAYYMSKTGLKTKCFKVQFILHRKPSIEDYCSLVGDSYYLLSTYDLNFKTAFTWEQ